MVVNCSGITGLDNLWQCAQHEHEKCSNPAVVICEGNTHTHTHITYTKVLLHISEKMLHLNSS